MAELFVTMPQLGESVSEGTIERWLVEPGQPVAEFEALLVITTDKVETEVPAPATGVLREILAPEGSVIPVGDPIAVLEVARADPEDAAAAATGPVAGVRPVAAPHPETAEASTRPRDEPPPPQPPEPGADASADDGEGSGP